MDVAETQYRPESTPVKSQPGKFVSITNRSRPFPVTVILCGIAISFLTLMLISLTERFTDIRIIGWNLKGFPVGAFGLGILASGGYGLCARASGMRFTVRMMWLIPIFQIAIYFAAQYIEFKDLHLAYKNRSSIGFWTYFDIQARSYAWKLPNGGTGETLGIWGYSLRLLEIIAFAAGGLMFPTVMRALPYCERCQKYMRKEKLAFIPASVPQKEINRSDTNAMAAFQEECEKAFAEGKEALETFQIAAVSGHLDACELVISRLAATRKQTIKLPAHFRVDLSHCPICLAGSISSALVTEKDNQRTRTPLNSSSVPDAFIRKFSRGI